MKHIKELILFSAALALIWACKAVDLSWNVETTRVQPAVFEAYHGETLNLEATMLKAGKPLADALQGEWKIYWQTNSMDQLWWSAPVSAPIGNKVSATFTGEMDPGANVVNGFIGCAGENYRAAFIIRFRHSPGSTPNTLLKPVPILDLANTTVINAPWPTDETIAATVRRVIEEDGITGSGGSVEVDTTLTQAGMAADAAAVGGRFEGVSQSFGSISRSLENMWEGVVNHSADANNPHGVTLEQIGASAVIEPRQASWYLSAASAGYVSGVYAVRAPVSDFIGGDSSLDIRRVAVKFSTHDTNTKLKLVVVNNDTVVSTFESDGTQTRKDDSDEEVWHFTGCKIPASSVSGNSFLQFHFKTTEGAAKTRQVWVRSGVAKYAISKNQSESPTVGWTGTLSPAIRLWAVASETEGGGVSAEELKAVDEKATQAGVQATLAGQTAQAVYAYMAGNSTNAWFAATNYVTNAEIAATRHKFAFEDGMDLSTVPSSMSLYEIRDGAKIQVWDQRDWTSWYWAAKSQAIREAIESLAETKADKSWGKYTAKGLDNPDEDCVWLDTSKVVLSAGYAWQKSVGTRGSFFTLIRTGSPASFGANTDGSYFEIKDDEGNSLFKISKTDSYMADATAESVSVSGDTLNVRYSANVAQTALMGFACVDLAAEDFISTDDPACPATLTWTGNAGNWVAHVTPKNPEGKLFFFAKVMVEGQTKIEHTAPTQFEKIVIGNTVYNVGTAVINGVTVLTLTR